MNTSTEERKKRAYEIFNLLKEEHPDARVLLNYRNPFELLVATILAAQCTDERVNAVTPELFRVYPDPASMARAKPASLEKLIRSTGFFKAKTKSLIQASKKIVEDFGGEVPRTIEELTALPGVGRKTANVVAGNCFGIPAIIVDTHLKRVAAARLALSAESDPGRIKDPDKIEMDLRAIIEEKDCTSFSYTLNFHGRYTCQARKPLCWKCRVEKLCPYPDKNLTD